jgi:mRNA interferase MazF
VELRPRSGSEQQGRRPAIVVSHDALNAVETWRSIIVVPITSSERQAKRYLTTVPLSAGEGGLPHASVALCHQVTTLDRSKFVERSGILSGKALQAVAEGLVVALALTA